MDAPLIGVTYLGSGSEGNAALLEFGRTRFLVDAGLSARRIRRSLAKVGLTLADLSGILLTHDHGDHVRGLPVLLKAHPVPVFSPEQTRRSLLHQGLTVPAHIPVTAGQELEREGIRIRPFRVSHDAVDPVGFRFEWQGRTVTIASDFGELTPIVLDHLAGSDILCLESNYDPDLLAACSYPDFLKRRIRGPRGHFPNTGVAPLLGRLGHSLTHLVLIHRSQESNRPDLVRQALAPALGSPALRRCQVTLADQHEATPRLLLSTGRPPARPPAAVRAVQHRFDFALPHREAAGERNGTFPAEAIPLCASTS